MVIFLGGSLQALLSLCPGCLHQDFQKKQKCTKSFNLEDGSFVHSAIIYRVGGRDLTILLSKQEEEAALLPLPLPFLCTQILYALSLPE